MMELIYKVMKVMNYRTGYRTGSKDIKRFIKALNTLDLSVETKAKIVETIQNDIHKDIIKKSNEIAKTEKAIFGHVI